MTLNAGTHLGRYEIRSKIGEGGMGQVYLAEDASLRRRVAIKLLPQASSGDQQANKRLLREARAAATLDHPNICSIHEVGDEGDQTFIVMQYIEGETLDAIIKKKTLDLLEVLSIAAQVADALAEAHAHGIIHRDIKPSNIIVTPRGLAKVMDFGLAKIMAGAVESEAETINLLTSPGTIIGTMAYMSPEQARGQNLDERSDIFSLGVVLYQMVAGRTPFEGTTAADLIASILKVEPPSLAPFGPGAPPELQHIVEKALRKDKRERYQTVRDMLDDLKGLSQELEFEAKRKRSAGGGAGTKLTTTKRPETKYARSGDINIAYQVVGTGPIDLVYVMGWVTNLDYFWEEPSYARFLARLASFSRLILFDKRGTGLSDRVHETELPTLEQRMDDVRAVMDAVDSSQAVLFGVSEGGPMCALFAATYPERTAGLVMYGSYAKRIWSPDYPWAPTPGERQEFFDLIQQGWGGVVDVHVLAPSRANDENFGEWWATYLRRSASPGAALAFARMNTQIDIRSVLPTIRVPTLVLHRTGDLDANVEGARYMAERIPGAKYIEFPSNDHLPWVGDQDSILDEIENFLGAIQHAPELDRVLSTVLVLHMAGPTSQSGVAEARETREHLSSIIRRNLQLFRGREIELTATRLFAAFDGPARAIKAACAISASAHWPEIKIKAGLHTGECDAIGDKLTGTAVDIADKVAAKAKAGEVMVSTTVKDLVAGSGIGFESRGSSRFEGIDGKLQLFAVKRDSQPGTVKKAAGQSHERVLRRSKAINSLAIMPLVNAISDPDMEYLSDGITESIINTLSQLPRLRVMAHSTIFRYKGKEFDVQEVGQSLGVRAALTGRVLLVGDRLVIGVELVDVTDGSQIWGEQFSRERSDIFVVQEEISTEITEKLSLRLSGAQRKRLARRYTDNPEAYQLYLRGRYCWNKRTEEATNKSIELYLQAIQLDPAYALAHAGLSDSYTKLGDIGIATIPPKEAFAKARAAANRALSIDERLAEAHASLGHLDMHEFRWRDAENEFKAAIQFSPSYAAAHHWYAFYFAFVRQPENSLKQAAQALKLDPLSLPINQCLAELLLYASRSDEALAQLRKTLELDPDWVSTHSILAQVYERKNMYSEALTESKRAFELSGGSMKCLSALAYNFALAGNQEEARKLLARLVEISMTRYVSPYDLAVAQIALGNRDESIQCLEQGYVERAGAMIYLGVDSRFDCLRDDDRFMELLSRIGVA